MDSPTPHLPAHRPSWGRGGHRGSQPEPKEGETEGFFAAQEPLQRKYRKPRLVQGGKPRLKSSDPSETCRKEWLHEDLRPRASEPEGYRDKQDSEHLCWRRRGSPGGRDPQLQLCKPVLLAGLEAKRRTVVEGPGGLRHGAAMTCARGLWRSHGRLLSADPQYLRWRVGEVVARPGELRLGRFRSYPAQLGSQLDLISHLYISV